VTRAVLRPSAEQDLIDVTQWYRKEGGPALAGRFFDAARSSLVPIQRMPGLGSPAAGLLCGIPGLRAWAVEKFPVRWFYIEREDHLDVLRLLADRQDTAAILSDEAVSPVIGR
jgi:toxin ParE1/3/4